MSSGGESSEDRDKGVRQVRGDAQSKALRKEAKAAAKAESKAARAAPLEASYKPCHLCLGAHPLLIRCRTDASGAWRLVCGKCWKTVSGGKRTATPLTRTTSMVACGRLDGDNATLLSLLCEHCSHCGCSVKRTVHALDLEYEWTWAVNGDDSELPSKRPAPYTRRTRGSPARQAP